MNKIETVTIAAFIGLSPVACRSEEGSGPQSIFGDLNGYFMTKENQDAMPIAKNVGSLYARSDHDVIPFCTAFLIDEGKILTNKHCYEAIASIDALFARKDFSFHFSNDFMAKLPDPSQMNFSLAQNGGIQSFFIGEVEERRHADDAVVDFRNPLYLSDDHLDVALFKLEQTFRDQVKFQIVDSSHEIMLISHPGSLPKFVSSHCQILTESASEVTHDCDSLPGSSGGLIVDAVTQRPIAIHKSGLPTSWPLEAERELYKKSQQFQTRLEAAESYCKSRGFFAADCPENMLSLASNKATKLLHLDTLNP